MDSLIDVAQNAVDNGIDYFYLRMRLGIAYYNKAEYKRAAVQFDKALSFNPWTQTALEYAYYSYVYPLMTPKPTASWRGSRNRCAKGLRSTPLVFLTASNIEGGVGNKRQRGPERQNRHRRRCQYYGEMTRFNDSTYYHVGFKHCSAIMCRFITATARSL